MASPSTQPNAPYRMPPEVLLAIGRTTLALGALVASLGLARSAESVARALASAGMAPDVAGQLGRALAMLAELAEHAGKVGVSEHLTPREREVLALLTLGLSDRAIAARLGISPHTAATHVKRVRSKLGGGARDAVVARVLLGADPVDSHPGVKP